MLLDNAIECSQYDNSLSKLYNTDQGCSEDGNHILAEVLHVGRDPTYWRLVERWREREPCTLCYVYTG